MADDKVTVYISTCNRLELLKRAVSSVLTQDYTNIELIICDDASNDGTKQYSLEISQNDPRVKYMRNDFNKGACATRNLAIFSATGKFITGLDDDDTFSSNRISYFISNWDEKYSFLCANFTNKFDDKEFLNYSNNTGQTFCLNDILFENQASNQIFTLTSRLVSIGGFDISVKRLQDWDTWLKLTSMYGQFLRLPASTYVMYHNHSINTVRVSNSYSFLKALEDLRDRNIDLYDVKSLVIMNHIISLGNKTMRLTDYIHFLYLLRNIKLFFSYVYQYRIKKKI
ncbi:glycosyltransferase [Acerihabitans sp. KWT182]|uniref:Glycosyltransferase n=1 Tax=Acerihabitans sp. KWT182 TaxID=3157919 RepID=A0AAU7Q821_9GAMM